MAQQSLIPDEHLTRTLGDLAADYSPMEVVEAVRHLWQDLLDPSSTPARLTDRQTSQDAAAKHATRDATYFRRGSTSCRVLSMFSGSNGREPITALAAARAATLGNDTVHTETARKRVPELERAGFIAAVGVSVQEGNARTTYRITDAGRAALENLHAFGATRRKETA